MSTEQLWTDEARHNRRMAQQDRFLCNEEKRTAKVQASCLIGELCIEGQTFYYINLKTKSGAMTGKIKQSRNWFELRDYLLRNNYL